LTENPLEMSRIHAAPAYEDPDYEDYNGQSELPILFTCPTLNCELTASTFILV